MSFLEKKIAEYRQFPSKQRFTDTLALLLYPSPDAEKVREWLKEHARENLYKDYTKKPDNSEIEDWEEELWDLAGWFVAFEPMSSWERASNKVRGKHSRKVATLARELAKALEDEVRPYYPPAFEFLDLEIATDILRSLAYDDPPDHNWAARHDAPAYYANSDFSRVHPPRKLALRFSYPEPQYLSPILRRLAEYSDRQINNRKRDTRPNASVDKSNARAFARYIAGYFRVYFLREEKYLSPNTVIAACVALKYPDLYPSPTGETIGDWLDS